jgi:hypothetical protein
VMSALRADVLRAAAGSLLTGALLAGR